MSFTSWTFALFFVAAVLGYWLLPGRFRWMWLLSASWLFYIWAEPVFGLYLLYGTLITWICAWGMDTLTARQTAFFASEAGAVLTKEEKKQYKSCTLGRKKALMVLCIILHIGLLAMIKYAGLLTGGQGLGWLVMPLGISFYTFQSLGYVIDVFRESVPCQKNFFRYALYVSFFPHICQGPIGRYADLAPQLFTPVALEKNRLVRGLGRMLLGFFKKLVIAGRLGLFVDGLYSSSPQQGGVAMALATVGYAFQLYADFSGYMDIAIGAAHCFHIRLDENFRTPYLSQSIAEYWRRWHSTLGSWFRDYLYYPVLRSGWCSSLGKKLSRSGHKKLSKNLTTAIGLACTWVLIGFWHGSTANFLVHGIYHGTFVILAAILPDTYDKVRTALHIRQESKWWQAFRVVRTFLIVNVGYVLFRSSGLDQALDILGKIFLPQNWNISGFAAALRQLPLTLGDWIVAFAGLGVMSIFDFLPVDTDQRFDRLAPWKKTVCFGALLLLLLIFGQYGIGFDASSFIYSQF